VANVSHELRTPLTSISGYVETLLDHEESMRPQAREFLTTILKNATRMHRLTEDLLALARVESGENEMRLRPIPARELLQDAVKAVSGLIRESDAVLETGVIADGEVMADADAIVQVLGNLMENAIKYGKPRNGPARVELSAESSPEYPGFTLFKVKDSGPGIASEHLGRIFERFYRVDKARSRELEGTGLGLSIAQHIIHAHGGTIWAESELNRGSCFCFTLAQARVLSMEQTG
jgi:two-component system phosphate regulon sensor histidine kinase PhoR